MLCTSYKLEMGNVSWNSTRFPTHDWSMKSSNSRLSLHPLRLKLGRGGEHDAFSSGPNFTFFFWIALILFFSAAEMSDLLLPRARS